jgi:hypothetical protein
MAHCDCGEILGPIEYTKLHLDITQLWHSVSSGLEPLAYVGVLLVKVIRRFDRTAPSG